MGVKPSTAARVLIPVGSVDGVWREFNEVSPGLFGLAANQMIVMGAGDKHTSAWSNASSNTSSTLFLDGC